MREVDSFSLFLMLFLLDYKIYDTTNGTDSICVTSIKKYSLITKEMS